MTSTLKLITADKICHYYYKTSLTKMWCRVANLVPSSQAPTKLPGTIKGCENKSQQADCFNKLFKLQVH